MGFKTGDFPPVDPETWYDRPYLERIRVLSTQWAEYGFGTPKMVHAIYIVKVLVLYITGGVLVATTTSGLTPWDVGSWWTEPIIYEKFILWTVLLETMGMASVSSSCRCGRRTSSSASSATTVCSTAS